MRRNRVERGEIVKENDYGLSFACFWRNSNYISNMIKCSNVNYTLLWFNLFPCKVTGTGQPPIFMCNVSNVRIQGKHSSLANIRWFFTVMGKTCMLYDCLLTRQGIQSRFQLNAHWITRLCFLPNASVNLEPNHENNIYITLGFDNLLHRPTTWQTDIRIKQRDV